MITLQPHVRADIPLRVKWLNNKNANTFVTDDPNHVTTVDEQSAWFDRYESDDKKQFFTIYNDKNPIGFIGLSNIDYSKKQASVFIMIGEDQSRGKGNGAAALKLLLEYGLSEIGVEVYTLEVFKENIPAVRLYTSAGFEHVGDIDGMLAMQLVLPT